MSVFVCTFVWICVCVYICMYMCLCRCVYLCLSKGEGEEEGSRGERGEQQPRGSPPVPPLHANTHTQLQNYMVK